MATCPRVPAGIIPWTEEPRNPETLSSFIPKSGADQQGHAFSRVVAKVMISDYISYASRNIIYPFIKFLAVPPCLECGTLLGRMNVSPLFTYHHWVFLQCLPVNAPHRSPYDEFLLGCWECFGQKALQILSRLLGPALLRVFCPVCWTTSVIKVEIKGLATLDQLGTTWSRWAISAPEGPTLPLDLHPSSTCFSPQPLSSSPLHTADAESSWRNSLPMNHHLCFPDNPSPDTVDEEALSIYMVVQLSPKYLRSNKINFTRKKAGWPPRSLWNGQIIEKEDPPFLQRLVDLGISVKKGKPRI